MNIIQNETNSLTDFVNFPPDLLMIQSKSPKLTNLIVDHSGKFSPDNHQETSVKYSPLFQLGIQKTVM